MKKDRQFCRFINLVGAPGTGKSRMCIELNGILSQYANQASWEVKNFIQNAIHVHVTYFNGSEPTERDMNPADGLAWRIIKSSGT
jgi:hypothetical protein